MLKLVIFSFLLILSPNTTNGRGIEPEPLTSFPLGISGNSLEILKLSSAQLFGKYEIHNKGVGIIKLGSKSREFSNAFPEARAESASGGSGFLEYYFNDEDVPSLRIYAENHDPTSPADRLVTGIGIYSSRFTTKKNIGVGSTIQQLLKAYTFKEAVFLQQTETEGPLLHGQVLIKVKELPNITFHIYLDDHLNSDTPAKKDLPMSATISYLFIE